MAESCWSNHHHHHHKSIAGCSDNGPLGTPFLAGGGHRPRGRQTHRHASITTSKASSVSSQHHAQVSIRNRKAPTAMHWRPGNEDGCRDNHRPDMMPQPSSVSTPTIRAPPRMIPIMQHVTSRRWPHENQEEPERKDLETTLGGGTFNARQVIGSKRIKTNQPTNQHPGGGNLVINCHNCHDCRGTGQRCHPSHSIPVSARPEHSVRSSTCKSGKTGGAWKT